MLAMQRCVSLLLLLGACAGSTMGPNTLQRSLLQVELTERQAEAQRLERRVWQLEQEIVENQRKANQAQEDTWKTEAELQVQTAELVQQLLTLHAAEEDEKAAVERKAEIELALVEVRELEQALAQRDLRLKELQAQIEEADGKVAAAEAEYAQHVVDVAARFAELEERSKVLESLEVLVQKALLEVMSIAGPFFGEATEEGEAPAEETQQQDVEAGASTSGRRGRGRRGGS